MVGIENRISWNFATVTGGYNKWADSYGATVSGGSGNIANGNFASVSGGGTVSMSSNSGWAGGIYHTQ